MKKDIPILVIMAMLFILMFICSCSRKTTKTPSPEPKEPIYYSPVMGWKKKPHKPPLHPRDEGPFLADSKTMLTWDPTPDWASYSGFFYKMYTANMPHAFDNSFSIEELPPEPQKYILPLILTDTPYFWQITANAPNMDESGPSNEVYFVYPVIKIKYIPSPFPPISNTVLLTWLSTKPGDGLNYVLQFTEDLLSGVWFDDLESTNTAIELDNGLNLNTGQENINPDVNRFFRIDIRLEHPPIPPKTPKPAKLDFKGEPFVSGPA